MPSQQCTVEVLLYDFGGKVIAMLLAPTHHAVREPKQPRDAHGEKPGLGADSQSQHACPQLVL